MLSAESERLSNLTLVMIGIERYGQPPHQTSVSQLAPHCRFPGMLNKYSRSSLGLCTKKKWD